MTAAAHIIAAATTDFAPRYVAMMLMIPGSAAGWAVGLAWVSNIMPRPPAKRAAALAMVNAVCNCSSIYTSYMYTGAPRFGTSFLSLSLCKFT